MSTSMVDLSQDPRFGGPRHVHIRGFYGDDGENEGVLSVTSWRDMGPDDPKHLAITIGSPQSSPLIEGYLPNLGGFSCSIAGARVLAAVLQDAIVIANGGRGGDLSKVAMEELADLTPNMARQGRTLVHIRGFHAAGTEGVLAISVLRDMSSLDPDHTGIIVGSPKESPLLEKMPPDLGGFSCGVDAAKLLIQEINAGIEVAQGKR